MKKNEGIILSGGKLSAKNLAVGNQSKVEANQSSKVNTENDNTSENNILASELKELISKGSLKEVINKMLDHFKSVDDKKSLNATIMHSSSLTQLEMQENLGVITHEQGKIDRAKVNNYILQLIDNHIDR